MAGSGSRLIPRLLRDNREFRKLFAGQAVSLFGDQVTLIALPLLAILTLGAGAGQMGVLTAAGLAPNLLFAMHAGAWVDRVGQRRRTMIGADVGRAAAIATIPIASAAGVLTLGHLYVVAFVVGTLSVLFFVSQSTLFVSIVPRERYIEANSILHGSRAFSFVAGPSVGGALVQFLTAAFALVVDALSFVLSAVFLLRIRVIEPAVDPEARGRLLAGVRFIRRSAIMRAALGATATINFFNFVFLPLFLLYATRALRLRPATVGLVLGAGAVGGVIGTLVTARLARRIGVGRTFVLGCVLFPAPLVLVPLAGGPTAVVIAMLFLAEFGAGMGVMMLDISGASIFATVVPDALRARVTGAYLTVNYGVRPAGSLVGGALGGLIGLRPTLWIATLGALAGFLWLLPSPIPKMHALAPESEV